MSTTTDRIEKQIFLRAKRQRVWRALTDPAEFGYWFGLEFSGPLVTGQLAQCIIRPTKVDASVAETQKPYDGLAFDLLIERMDAEHVFAFRWHPGAVDPSFDPSTEERTLVTFTLSDEKDGTRLVLTETGFDKIPLERRAKAFAGNDGGWTAQMVLIEKYLQNAAS